MGDHGITRRHTLTGAAVVGVGVPLLTACGSSDTGTATEPAGSTSATPSDSATPSTTPSAAPSKTPSTEAPAADALTTTADVPEGGGAIFNDERVVVTQPTAGEFKCFTAVCPHQGCLVSSVDGGTISCSCHGSTFSIDDGSVQNGPATSGLSEVAISVQGDSISLS